MRANLDQQLSSSFGGLAGGCSKGWITLSIGVNRYATVSMLDSDLSDRSVIHSLNNRSQFSSPETRLMNIKGRKTELISFSAADASRIIPVRRILDLWSVHTWKQFKMNIVCDVLLYKSKLTLTFDLIIITLTPGAVLCMHAASFLEVRECIQNKLNHVVFVFAKSRQWLSPDDVNTIAAID